VKDAVCDRFRADTGRRPDVDTRAPAVRIHAFLDARTVTFYLDTSGEPLWKRGWRGDTGDAPLRENLAAGIVRLSGWSGDEPFLDPMCGSGTIVLEAAALALGIAPGSRRRFGFENLAGFDAPLLGRLREEARAAEQPRRRVAIFGADKAGSEVARARAAIEAAGLVDAIQLKQANALELPPPAPHGVLVANPPYGVRVGDEDELDAFYPKLGDALKARYAGWRCYFLTADLRLAKLIGLKASKRTPLYNGPLECRLFEFKIVAGSMRRAPGPLPATRRAINGRRFQVERVSAHYRSQHKTVAELREIAKGIEHEAVKGYTQMNKDHLLVGLCKALGLDMHVHHHHAAGEERNKIKAKIKTLKKKRDEILASKSRDGLGTVLDEIQG
jgi:putative N6-adenine-specific DNA methylase